MSGQAEWRVVLIALSGRVLAGLLAITTQEGFQERLADVDALVPRAELRAAEEKFPVLVQTHPESSVVHNDFGALHMSQRRYMPACNEFRLASGLKPGLLVIYQNPGICLFQVEGFLLAVEALRSTKQLDPQGVKNLPSEVFVLNTAQVGRGATGTGIRSSPEKMGRKHPIPTSQALQGKEENAIAAFHELVLSHPDSVFAYPRG